MHQKQRFDYYSIFVYVVSAFVAEKKIISLHSSKLKTLFNSVVKLYFWTYHLFPPEVSLFLFIVFLYLNILLHSYYLVFILILDISLLNFIEIQHVN
jgi:hypothetical protein